MNKDSFIEVMTDRLREKVAQNRWSLDTVQYGINTIKEATDNIYKVEEMPDGYEIHFIGGSNVPRCIGHLYNIHTYLRAPVYCRVNGVLARVESTE